jgi:hypothetical protein
VPHPGRASRPSGVRPCLPHPGARGAVHFFLDASALRMHGACGSRNLPVRSGRWNPSGTELLMQLHFVQLAGRHAQSIYDEKNVVRHPPFG